MTSMLLLFAALPFLSAVCTVPLLYKMWPNRNTPTGGPLLWLLCAVGSWSFLYTFEVLATTLPTKLLFFNLQCIAVVCVAPAWCVVALRWSALYAQGRWYGCIAIPFALALIAFSSAAEPPLEHVTLQLKWKHQFQFAGYYAAIEKGFYRDAGLEVTVAEVETGKSYVEPVLTGRAEFGVASSELAVMRAHGDPVVVLAPIYQHSPLILLVSGEANVDNVHELAGKRVMIAPEETELFAYFQAEGLEPKTLNLVPHEHNPQLLIDHRVDAMSAYSTDEPFDLELAKVKFSMFKPRSGASIFMRTRCTRRSRRFAIIRIA